MLFNLNQFYLIYLIHAKHYIPIVTLLTTTSCISSTYLEDK